MDEKQPEDYQLEEHRRDSEPILRYFLVDYLSPQYRIACAPFLELAENIVQSAPRGAERTVSLRRLLESRDSLLRALMVFALLLVATVARAQTPAVPTNVDVLIFPPSVGDPLTAPRSAAVVISNVVLSASSGLCNQPAHTMPPPNAPNLVNPLSMWFGDPYRTPANSRSCAIPMPVIPDGLNYIGVVQPHADKCDVSGQILQPCPGPRTVAVPRFDVRPLINPPAALGNAAVK